MLSSFLRSTARQLGPNGPSDGGTPAYQALLCCRLLGLGCSLDAKGEPGPQMCYERHYLLAGARQRCRCHRAARPSGVALPPRPDYYACTADDGLGEPEQITVPPTSGFLRQHHSSRTVSYSF